MTENTQRKNPLIERVRLPGETHTLPSRGLFYNDGELRESASGGEVHVFPMTTIDEITMKSPDLLFSGEAIRQVFGRCIPDVQKPGSLLAKDVDFLLTILRRVTYGSHFEIVYRHTCDGAKDHTYTIDMERVIKQVRRLDPTTIVNELTVKLENDQVVKFAPMKFDDMIEMLQLAESKKELTPEEVLKRTIKYLSDMIQSVDGVTDKEMIKEWLETVPAGWTRKFEDAINTAQDDWGVDFNVQVKCKDCGEIVKVNAPLNPLFFFI